VERILITGGAGFVGSNLAAYYLKCGRKVIVYDNLSRKNSEKNLDWLKSLKNSNLSVVIGDIREFKKLQKVVNKVDAIFHLAAQVAVTKSIENPQEDFEVNALGTLNVLEAARKARHKPIVIYASTNKVYGAMEEVAVKEKKTRYAFKNLPQGISEKQALDFFSPYGCSKGTGDQYMRDYARIYDLPTVVFRKSCIYGPRQFGVEDQGWVTHFVISAVKDCPITIYGNGKQVRDILEIEDLIRVFEAAVKNIKHCQGEVYNIGGGPKNSVSLLELIGELEKILGKKIFFSFSQWRPGDQKVYVSNISKAKKELGWEPRVGKKEGIFRLCSWVLDNKSLFS